MEGPDAGAVSPVAYEPDPGRPLIPFGGGIDSIVTVASLAADHPDAALCVVEPPNQRFAAIEDAAAVTGLPVTRIVRTIDPLVRRSSELGFLNGHVPVTAIVSAAALVAAVLDRRDAVVLSNEWSASVPTLVTDGHAVNHQWSKSDDFEQAFGDLVLSALGPSISVFSYLRPRSELWVGATVRRPHRSTTAPFAAAIAPSTRTRRSGSTIGAAVATSAASSTSSSPRSWTASSSKPCSRATSPCRTPATRSGSGPCWA